MSEKNKKFEVWTCKILVPEGTKMTPGFDLPPRTAAIEAVEKEGIHVIACASGWGGTLTKEEQEFYNRFVGKPSDSYYAGLVDCDTENDKPI